MTLTRALAPAVLLSGLLSGTPHAVPWHHPDPACEGREYRQFDFWLGAWNVDQRIRTADGTYLEFPAVDTVEAALDGCAIVEHWHGTVQFFWAGMTAPARLQGLSVRTWDAREAVWRIHWMDSRDPRFGEPFTGTFSDGMGVFTLEAAGPDGTTSLRRIAFTPGPDGSVDWELAVSSNHGRDWMVLWTMHFTPAGKAVSR